MAPALTKDQECGCTEGSPGPIDPHLRSSWSGGSWTRWCSRSFPADRGKRPWWDERLRATGWCDDLRRDMMLP